MSVRVVIGTQWGDEGKGKIVDYLCKDVDLVVRFQGGSNAGHTVKIGKKVYRFHLLPSGVIRGKIGVIANGVVVDPEVLIDEIERLRSENIEPKLMVSDRANVVMIYHKLLDGAEEEYLGRKRIGTTRRGIGPCYSDKVARRGIRVGDLLDEDVLREKMELILPVKRELMKVYGVDFDLDIEDLTRRYLEYGEKIREFVKDTSYELNKAVREGKEILLEGAQGVMLDVDFGTYPYTTSSNTVAGNACTGSGISPRYIDEIIGVVKSYTTRVGGGPFPTELRDDIGKHIQMKGGEFGTTTGRARRCGWLDLVVVRHACTICGIDGLALTKLDVLDGLRKVKICVGYEYGGEVLDRFPSDLRILENLKPVYEEFDGWRMTKKARTFEDLPKEARDYVRFIEEFLEIPINIISVGAEREETITL